MDKAVSGQSPVPFSPWNGPFLQRYLVPFTENETAYLEARGFECEDIWEETNRGTRYTQSVCSKNVYSPANPWRDWTTLSFYRHTWTPMDKGGEPAGETIELWDLAVFLTFGENRAAAFYNWADTLFMTAVPDRVLRFHGNLPASGLLPRILNAVQKAGLFTD